jgi:hypothetical protein
MRRSLPFGFLEWGGYLFLIGRSIEIRYVCSASWA